MARIKVPRRGRVLPIVGTCGLLALAGCGGLKCVPVSGTLTVDGKPLPGFGLSFIPDASKGNHERVGCLGRFDAQGHYELKAEGVKGSDRGRGAPLGWYKVVLIVDLEGMPKVKPKIDPKYLDVNQTPLAVEVVADPEPGRYDFKLPK
jgi:hypothetical protein